MSIKEPYIKHQTEGYILYAPWFEPEFLKWYAQFSHRTVVKEDRCYMLRQFSQYAAQLDGDFAECGCYRGGTAWLLGESSQGKEGRKLHLFDTFEGMPVLADSDPGGHKKGDFGDTSLESVKELLSGYNHVEYHPGFIPTTFDGVDGRFAFVHVDVDLFETSSACYEFFYPKMVKGGIMICDDYGFRKYQTSARKAVDSFFADKPEVVVTLPTGQALVIKL